MTQFSHQLPHKGQSVCIVLPKTLQIKAFAEALGYKYLESHFAIFGGSPLKENELFEKVQRQ